MSAGLRLLCDGFGGFGFDTYWQSPPRPEVRAQGDRSASWRPERRRCRTGGLVQWHPGHNALLVCCHHRDALDQQTQPHQPSLLLPLAQTLPLWLPDLEANHCHLLFPFASITGFLYLINLYSCINILHDLKQELLLGSQRTIYSCSSLTRFASSLLA